MGKANERTDQSSRKNITKQRRDSQPIRCTVQNTGNQEAHRLGWIWSQIRWKNEGYAKRNKGKCQQNKKTTHRMGEHIHWYIW